MTQPPVLPGSPKDKLLQLLEDPKSLFKTLRQELAKWQSDNSNSNNKVSPIEAEYLRAATRRFDELNIFGVNFGGRARKYQLSVAYISLKAEMDNNSTTDTGISSTEVMSAETAFARFQRLVILGEAGQGKTTLLQWLAVQCGRPAVDNDVGNKQAPGNNAAPWHHKIPVLIKLREELKRAKLPDKVDFYTLTVQYIEPRPQHQDWIESILREGRAIIMIDGFDEVPQPRRLDVLKWIGRLGQIHGDNQIIMTSRPAAYGEKVQAALERLSFQTIRLQAMDASAREAFVAHWHQAVAQKYDKTRQDALQQQSGKLIQQLEQPGALRHLAQNPLLCGVICLLHHARGYLPKNRTELYETSCDMLLEERDRQSQVPEDARFDWLDKYSKQAFLIDVAQCMSQQQDTTITAAQFTGRLVTMLAHLPEVKAQVKDVAALQQFLLERSGLLVKVSADEFQFTHRSFQEFLTAKYLLKHRDWATLKRHVDDNYWHETIQMAVGLCENPLENQRFLIDLLEQSNETNKTLIYLLVLRCREMMREISPELDRLIKAILPKVIPPTSIEMSDALADSGELALPYLEQALAEEHSDKARLYCLRSIIKINTSAAIRSLVRYFQPRQPDDINPLCQLLEHLSLTRDEADNLVEQLLLIGLDSLPQALCRKLAFLLQDARVMPASTATSLGKNDFTDWELAQGLAPLAKLVGLQDLTLRGTSVSDLYPIAGLSELRWLNLSGTKVNDLVPLAGLIKLKDLTLRETGVTDLSSIGGLSGLRYLDLTETKVSDLSPIAGLTGLWQLNLSGTKVSDLAPLTGLIELKDLTLRKTNVSNLFPIAELSGLKCLNLTETKVSDLSPIAGISGLRELDLIGTKVSDLSPITGLSGLWQLYLSGTKVSDLAPLTGLIELQKLALRMTNLTDLTPLAGLCKLQKLDLSWTKVNDLSPLIALTNLRYLDVSRTSAKNIDQVILQLLHCDIVQNFKLEKPKQGTFYGHL